MFRSLKLFCAVISTCSGLGVLAVWHGLAVLVFGGTDRDVLTNMSTPLAGVLCLAVGVALLAVVFWCCWKLIGFKDSLETVVALACEGESVSDQEKSGGVGPFDNILDDVFKIVNFLGSCKADLAALREECTGYDQSLEAGREEMESIRQRAEASRCQGLLSAAETLSGVLEGVRREAARVDSASVKARSGAMEQQRYMSEAATAMEEMNASVNETATSAEAAAKAAESAMQQASTGAGIVEGTLQSIESASASSRNLTNRVTGLGQQAEAVGRIMGVISDIADQTNLLALNAAIEAARAGDAGRGFAVVADEVRKLAEKTMEATKDVGVEIQAIQNEVELTVKGVEDMASLADSAAGQAGESGQALEEIVSHTNESAERIRQIATAAGQQTLASESITKTMSEVNVISESTGDEMTESTDAVSALAERIDDLAALIEAFRLVGNGRVQSVLDDLGKSEGMISMQRDQMEDILKRTARNHGFLELLYVTDAHGVQVVSNIGGKVTDYVEDREAFGSKWADREWFAGAMENQTYYVSDVYESSASGEKCITVSAPFKSAGGGLLGVIAVDVRLAA